MLVLPFMLIMCFIFIGGIFQAVVQSLGYLPAFGMNDFTLDYYRQVLGNSRFVSSLFNSFYIAAVSSLLSVSAGTFMAFLFNKNRSGSFALYKMPVIMPHLVAVILAYYTFSQTGIVSRLLYAINIINDPNSFPLFVYDRFNTSVILVYLYKQIPFVALTVLAVLKNLDKKYSQAAENLGAGKWLVLTRVTLPLLAPSVLSAFLVIFAFDFGAFEVPFVLGSPSKLSLPVLAYYDHINAGLTSRPSAMVTNVVISLVSILLISIYSSLFNILTKRGMEGEIL